MPIKEKILGIILIVLGAFPFALKVDRIANFFAKYTFLSYLTPGEWIFQAVLIIIGILLLWRRSYY